MSEEECHIRMRRAGNSGHDDGVCSLVVNFKDNMADGGVGTKNSTGISIGMVFGRGSLGDLESGTWLKHNLIQ